MKVSAPFKNAIQSYLEQRAEYDELFARSYRNPLKNIEDCITYILNYVQKSGCNGFDDDEIFGQAVHYYDEADIEIGKPIECKVVVNHHVELTEEEKAQARRDAVKRAEDEAYAKLKQQREKATAKRTATIGQPQPSLFDF
ncbi:PcfK-like family protein [Parabacteroides faecis]|uniref:PcfK-like family protein n=1 Tax=Parabacteroides faecis TaxID=1217282 RepID=UPI0021649D44|nr:PcfK-like family protein [Parabacteroides faecis]MCS2893518.1 PcfK-like family protein [Parabacteroides faecis]UVQ47884.1 PcfK-like family protein [Parabacteroides faecis]